MVQGLLSGPPAVFDDGSDESALCVGLVIRRACQPSALPPVADCRPVKLTLQLFKVRKGGARCDSRFALAIARSRSTHAEPRSQARVHVQNKTLTESALTLVCSWMERDSKIEWVGKRLVWTVTEVIANGGGWACWNYRVFAGTGIVPTVAGKVPKVPI